MCIRDSFQYQTDSGNNIIEHQIDMGPHDLKPDCKKILKFMSLNMINTNLEILSVNVVGIDGRVIYVGKKDAEKNNQFNLTHPILSAEHLETNEEFFSVYSFHQKQEPSEPVDTTDVISTTITNDNATKFTWEEYDLLSDSDI